MKHAARAEMEPRLDYVDCGRGAADPARVNSGDSDNLKYAAGLRTRSESYSLTVVGARGVWLAGDLDVRTATCFSTPD